MTAATLTLTGFLLARIAEDEAMARAAESAGSLRWELFGSARIEVADSPEQWDTFSHTVVFDEGSPSGEQAAHIVRHDPARVLAECEAKRRIVQWHAETEDCCEERLGPLQFEEGPLEAGTDVFGDLTLRQSFATQRHLGCVTLMHLAAAYADHPDYRDEWTP